MADSNRPPLTRGDSSVSARDSSYWLALASTRSFSSVSSGDSARGLDASFLRTVGSSRRALWDLRGQTILPSPAELEDGATAGPDDGEPSESAQESAGEQKVLKPPPSLFANLPEYADVLLVPTRHAVPRSTRSAASLSMDDAALDADAAGVDRRMIQSMPASLKSTGASRNKSSSLWTNSSKHQSSSRRHRPSRAVIVAEVVYENQRYQHVLGWGAKGHLLPLDPAKYARAVRRLPHSTSDKRDLGVGGVLRRRSMGEYPFRSRSANNADRLGPHGETSLSSFELEDVPIKWINSSTFPDVTLPDVVLPQADSKKAGAFSRIGDSEQKSKQAAALRRMNTTSRRKWVRFRRLRSGRSSSEARLSHTSAFDDSFLDSMSGWLKKLGHVRKNWKARYFVLEKSILRYYSDENRSRLKGEVLLFHPATRVHYVDIHLTGGRDNTFAIQVGDYTLLLQAEHLSDRENWIYCIEDTLLCRDSYFHDPGLACDLRESVAQRRLLSSEALVFDLQNGQVPSMNGLRGRTTSNLVNLVASMHSKSDGVLRAATKSPVMLRLLRLSDNFLESDEMKLRIADFIGKFKQKYGNSSTRGSSSDSASPLAMRNSDPLFGGNGTPNSARGSSMSDFPPELVNVAVLQDARSLLALKNYRFFLERSLERIVEYLSEQSFAEASKLERLTFIPLQDTIYRLLESTVAESDMELFERNRRFLATQPPSFFEIPEALTSSTEWKTATLLLNTMDNYSLPSEKAAVLVEVARCIFETQIREHTEEENAATAMSADDFLPIFIFVLARCRLRSVAISRHLISETMVSTLMIGETGYYATMLEAAIGYIASFALDEAVASRDSVSSIGASASSRASASSAPNRASLGE